LDIVSKYGTQLKPHFVQYELDVLFAEF
jgi:hypothetical protein